MVIYNRARKDCMCSRTKYRSHRAPKGGYYLNLSCGYLWWIKNIVDKRVILRERGYEVDNY